MSSGGSVTRWLAQLQDGDAAAARRLWERYFRRLVGLARKRLGDTPRRVADEEDVALSALDSFCRNAAEGRYPDLLDRHGLWRLLVVLTARKALHLRRDQARQRRGGAAAAAAEAEELDEVLGREPPPALAAQLAEEYGRLLAGLPERELEAIARWRMEGYSVEEIAGKLGCAPRSVKRKLRLIRGLWAEEVGDA
jgi:DNA-directed RNA polymerase specialized sigma24 family protein